MSGAAQAGLFIYAKDLGSVTNFYESLLAMSRLHTSEHMVVLQADQIQLIVHQIPEAISSQISIESPPVPRGDSALKFFLTVPSIASARTHATSLGGFLMDHIYQGPGFTACNAVDPEGNIFHVRERAA